MVSTVLVKSFVRFNGNRERKLNNILRKKEMLSRKLFVKADNIDIQKYVMMALFSWALGIPLLSFQPGGDLLIHLR